MKKLLSVLLIVILVMGLIGTPALAATPQQIEDAIVAGLQWLVAQQLGNGSWNAYYGQYHAGTGLALYKLCERAYELGYDSPFDPDYEYYQNVIDGFNWIFSNLSMIGINPQDHTTGSSGTVDDPDTNSNGVGIYASSGSYRTYSTGIVLAAISASGTPTRANEATSFNGTSTYRSIAQDMVDWLAWAQVEYLPDTNRSGGWEYTPWNNGVGGGWIGDQSNSGYAVLGLGEAEVFGCTIPDWVKTELSVWVDWVQDDIGGVYPYDGGSWYSYPGDFIGVNTYKTGNLIFQMALAGDTPATQRVQDALAYLEAHWTDAGGADSPPGWSGNPYGSAPAQYQAMFSIMKGLEYMGIDTFGAGPIDWFAYFSDAIVAQQDTSGGANDGSWQSSSGRGEPVIITEWALLTLEKVAPPPPYIPPEEPEVGGTIQPVNKFLLLTPWITLGILLAALGTIIIRRRSTQS